MGQIRQYDTLYSSASPMVVELTETLPAGSTTVVFNDYRIHENCSVAVYSDLEVRFMLNPETITTAEHQITIVFPVQERDISVKVRFV